MLRRCCSVSLEVSLLSFHGRTGSPLTGARSSLVGACTLQSSPTCDGAAVVLPQRLSEVFERICFSARGCAHAREGTASCETSHTDREIQTDMALRCWRLRPALILKSAAAGNRAGRLRT